MHSLKLLIVATFVLLHFEASSQAVSKEVLSFLEKFKVYANDHKTKVRRTMPITKPDGGSMPNAANILEAFMEDTKTGLRFYARDNQVYDPETGYYLEYDPEADYKIDSRLGKVYKGKTEVIISRKKAN